MAMLMFHGRQVCGDVTSLGLVQDLFVLLDLLGTELPSIYNYPYCADAEFRQLAAVERRLRKKGLLEDVPRIFRVKKSWSSPVGIEDDHLPFMRRG